MRVVLFADLHLDTAFAWAGREVARRRRQRLRDVLVRIAELAVDVHADALLCAGDLYEHDRVLPDTAEFVRRTFEDFHPLPVYLAPGNHAWFGPARLRGPLRLRPWAAQRTRVRRWAAGAGHPGRWADALGRRASCARQHRRVPALLPSRPRRHPRRPLSRIRAGPPAVAGRRQSPV